jgi:hypothetical protein
MEWDKNSDFVIVTHYENNDPSSINWLYELYPKVPIIAYNKSVDVPNHGCEASTYLKFISDNYYNLPKTILFLHGHENSWHQHNKIFKHLPELIYSDPYLKNKNYFNITYDFFNDRTLNNPVMRLLEKLWNTHFLPSLMISFPIFIYHLCCAQFIVKRAGVYMRPKLFYKQCYELSINIDYDSKTIAQLFEYIWHIMFGEAPVLTLEDRIQLGRIYSSLTPNDINDDSPFKNYLV